jgi:hypothetical protein
MDLCVGDFVAVLNTELNFLLTFAIKFKYLLNATEYFYLFFIKKEKKKIFKSSIKIEKPLLFSFPTKLMISL